MPRVKEVVEKVKWVYGYFNNHFKWQVMKGKDKWGYPGAVKNLVELLDMLGEATKEQKEVLERINDWREDKLKNQGLGVEKKEASVTTLESFVKSEVKELGVRDLLLRFMGAGRLGRAEEMKDKEISIVNDSENQIEARVKNYIIEIDLDERVIRHDCSDWIKGLRPFL